MWYCILLYFDASAPYEHSSKLINDCWSFAATISHTDPIQGRGHGGPKVVKMADFVVSSTNMHIIKRLMVY